VAARAGGELFAKAHGDIPSFSFTSQDRAVITGSLRK
jgi:hypothetical protein